MGSPKTRRPREPAPPALADTHAHLNLRAYRGDREDAIARAVASGVKLLVNVGFDLRTSRESIELAERNDFIYASVGLHPHEAATFDDGVLSELRRLAAHPKVVAIGEMGLDFYRNLSPAAAQREAFRGQIGLARELGLPIIIHNRDALDDVLRIVDDERAGDIGGVMHCFPGDVAYSEEVVRRGFLVGIGGPVTYSSRGRLAQVASAVGIDSMLLETDAPWLAPAPHRGKRNEPAYVALVARSVARLRGTEEADLARATTANAMRLFSIGEKAAPSIAYEMWGNLYLNITNRCTNQCSFCIRFKSDVLWGYNLKLDSEPTIEEIARAVGDPSGYREVVFCGYGEPTVRLDAVKEVGKRLRESGVRVRVDTNGHGNLIWGRNIVPELAQAVDAVSVSLNAPNREVYNALCRPRYGERTFDHVVSFIEGCRKAGLDVTVSVVDVPGLDMEAVRALARRLGVALKIRGAGRRPEP